MYIHIHICIYMCIHILRQWCAPSKTVFSKAKFDIVKGIILWIILVSLIFLVFGTEDLVSEALRNIHSDLCACALPFGRVAWCIYGLQMTGPVRVSQALVFYKNHSCWHVQRIPVFNSPYRYLTNTSFQLEFGADPHPQGDCCPEPSNVVSKETWKSRPSLDLANREYLSLRVLAKL